MNKGSYNIDRLYFCINRDKAIINDTNLGKLTRDSIITFNCRCGKEYKKVFRQIYEISGAYCKECTEKNKQDKISKTNIIKTGYSNPFKNPNVIKKFTEEYKNKTGYSNPGQNPISREKGRITYKNKTGYDHPSQNPEFKNKCKQLSLLRHCVEHPSQSEIIAEKMSRNAYKVKEITTPSGNKIYLQGYEPYAYNILLDNYKEDEIITNKKDVPKIWWVDTEGKSHRYFVDFYIPKDNLMIEVKSKRTYSLDDKKEKIEKTMKASKEAGYNMEVWVISDKGIILDKIIS